jgi:dTDP-glucose 4,6-dehydratase
VLNIDKLSYAGNAMNLADLKLLYPLRYTFQQADICHSDAIAVLIHDFCPDTIINFAAESHVDRSLYSPLDFAVNNIVGTVSLLWQTYKYGKSLSPAQRQNFIFHHVSTDEVFGPADETSIFREGDAYNPSSPYAASKAGADYFVRAWQTSYGLPVSISICSNNYGPWQFPEKLIPLTIINCLRHKDIPVYGDGCNTRDWLYVTDHCDAILAILKLGTCGSTYNICGNAERRNIDLVRDICALLDELSPSTKLNSYQELISHVQDRPGHDLRYAVSMEKLKRDTGWTPQISFPEGLRATVRWYLDNRRWWQDMALKVSDHHTEY